MSVEAEEYSYSYLQESTIDVNDGVDLRLATSGGTRSAGITAHPYFFDGYVEHAEIFASALLVVARVARTRYYTPPGMVAAVLRAADPLVTSNGDRLRFESFSACCGVYSRLDVLPDGMDRLPLDTGTTNVDFNSPMRDALAGVGGLDPLHMTVGADEVRVRTLQGLAVERRVPLPPRWVKGLAEVQLVSAAMAFRAEYSTVEVRRFLQSMPRGGQRGALYAVPAGRGLRLATRRSAAAVSVAGLERLRAVEPALRHATTVRAYGPPPGVVEAASGWLLNLPGGRLTIVLSPGVSRGFSGEGGVLSDLADKRVAANADLVAAMLAYEPTLDVNRLARDAGLDRENVKRAITRLAAAGRVGFDLSEQSYFHRELPYHPATLAKQHPRLRDARSLVDGGHVTVGDASTRVRSGHTTYVVRHTPDGDRCTCAWYASHRSERGPCKHILAALLARKSVSSPPTLI